MGYDWAERYVLKNRNYVLVLGLIFFPQKCMKYVHWNFSGVHF